MTLQAAIEQYVAWRQARGSKFASGTSILRQYARSVDDDIECNAVRPEQARAFLTGAGPLTRTRSVKRSALNGFYRYALGRGLATRSPLPADEPPEPESAPPYIYSPDDLHIYSPDDLHSLFAAVEPCRRRAASMDGSKPAICGHLKTGHFRRPETGVEIYFTASSVGNVFAGALAVTPEASGQLDSLQYRQVQIADLLEQLRGRGPGKRFRQRVPPLPVLFLQLQERLHCVVPLLWPRSAVRWPTVPDPGFAGLAPLPVTCLPLRVRQPPHDHATPLRNGARGKRSAERSRRKRGDRPTARLSSASVYACALVRDSVREVMMLRA